MKLTKLTALLETAKIWRGLARSGNQYKPLKVFEQWPATGCPCCWYTKEKSSDGFMKCDLCPMLSLWPHTCEAEGSPYQSWKESRHAYQRRKYAKIIADTASRLARQLRRKKGK